MQRNDCIFRPSTIRTADKYIVLNQNIIHRSRFIPAFGISFYQDSACLLYTSQKALEIGLKPIVVVNKVDKPNCRPEEVYEMVFDLMFSLNATEDQLDFPVIYGSAKNNWMSTDWQKPTETITPLLDCIIENIPAPTQLEGTPQMLITSLDYSSYTGRIAVGRVHRGTLKEGMNVTLVKRNGDMLKSKIKELHVFEGLGRVKTSEVSSGDICALVGIDGFEIGDTVCDFENPDVYKRQVV